MATTGCPSQALLQSAATVPTGKIQHQLGLEWFSVRYRRVSPATPGVPTTSTPSTYELPVALPFYGGRVGLAEHFDIGFRASAALTLGFDLKLQVIDTDAIDVAIAPNFQFAWVWSWMQLPLLVGLNLSDAVQIQLSGRIGYLIPMQEGLTGIDELDRAFGDRGGFAGGGLGLYIRLGDRVGLAPEVQILRGLGAAEPTLLSVSVGITFGAQAGVQPAAPEPLPPPNPLAPPGAPGYPAYPGPQPPGPPPPGYAPAVPPGYGAPPPAPPDSPSPWPVDAAPPAPPAPAPTPSPPPAPPPS